MGIDFNRPWLLVFLPVTLVIVVYTYLRWGTRSQKAKVALGMRITVILFLCLAMAGLSIVKSSDVSSLIVLADTSQSMADQTTEMENLIREIYQVLPEHYRVGVLSFARNALVERHFSDGSSGFYELETNPDERFTDISSALSFGSALFDNNTAKHMLLISDGKENLGNAENFLSSLQSQDIRVDIMVLDQENSDQQADAQVSKVELPSRLYEGESFDIKVTLNATQATEVSLLLYGDRSLIAEKKVQLQVGENTYVFNDIAQSSGTVEYRAVIQESGGITQNNQLSTVAKVTGQARVLIVEGSEDDGRELEKMLMASNIAVDRIVPASLSSDIAQLQPYQAIVLTNVSAEDLRMDQISTIETFIKTLGHGLLTTGGDNSYALGGYKGSPLEAILPVDMDVRNKLEMPSLGLVLVIDHSGSMSDGRFGITRQDLANEAAIRALEVLTEQDQIGVVAFDDTAKWVVEIQNPTNLDVIRELIGSIRPAGGTMMYSALNQAYLALQSADVKLKHIIVLTDGEPADSGFEDLVMQMREEGITLSSVGVGEGANQVLLERLANIANGRYYAANEFSNLPQIFAKETFLATQSYLQNVTFYPKVTASSPMTDAYSGFPALDGYIAAVTKPLATEVLTSDKDTPILAVWQYGLGRVASWMSDARGMWTEHYLSWDQGGQFFTGIVNYLFPGESDEGTLDVSVEAEQGNIIFETDQWEESQSKATVIQPDGTTVEVVLDATAPGRFEGQFDVVEEGAYAIRVEQTSADGAIQAFETGIPVGYSAEYDMRQSDGMPLLEKICAQTGGYKVEGVSDLFAHPMKKVESRVEIWPSMLWAGLILFVIDIAIRRLQWEPYAERGFAVAQQKWKRISNKKPYFSKAQRVRGARKIENINNTNAPEKAILTDERKNKQEKRKLADKPQKENESLGGQLLKRKKEKRKL